MAQKLPELGIKICLVRKALTFFFAFLSVSSRLKKAVFRISGEVNFPLPGMQCKKFFSTEILEIRRGLKIEAFSVILLNSIAI